MSRSSQKEHVKALAAPITLPCGLTLQNRLVKAAMEEMLGPVGGGDPQPEHLVLYEEWARGDWGLIITGNIQVASTHLGTPRDVVVPSDDSLSYVKSMLAFKAWSEAAHASGNSSPPPVIVQLCHTGRQSTRGSGRSPFTPSKSASAVPLNAGGNGIISRAVSRIVFGTPKEMSLRDIDIVVENFVQGARVSKEAGFEGVQLHCSHGYLLAQFLSPNVNIRKDLYGGSAFARMKIVFRIIDAIRDEFPLSSGFCLGVKLNSSDYVKGGLTEKEALDNVKWLAEHGGIDFIEISGGTYENPEMLKPDQESSSSRSAPSASTISREAFFTSFASSARSLISNLPSTTLPTPAPVILVTGGFRTRPGMASAILSSSTDLVGIGRPACADPLLPIKLLNSRLSDEEARAPRYKINGAGWVNYVPMKAILAPGVGTLFHTLLLTQTARNEKIDLNMKLWEGMWRLWLRELVMKNIPAAVIAFGVVLAVLRVALGR